MGDRVQVVPGICMICSVFSATRTPRQTAATTGARASTGSGPAEEQGGHDEVEEIAPTSSVAIASGAPAGTCSIGRAAAALRRHAASRPPPKKAAGIISTESPRAPSPGPRRPLDAHEERFSATTFQPRIHSPACASACGSRARRRRSTTTPQSGLDLEVRRGSTEDAESSPRWSWSARVARASRYGYTTSATGYRRMRWQTSKLKSWETSPSSRLLATRRLADLDHPLAVVDGLDGPGAAPEQEGAHLLHQAVQQSLPRSKRYSSPVPVFTR